MVIDTKNANGDSTALSTILENCKAEGVDLVIPIAASTAQSAKAVFDGTDAPIVFAAVSDPAAAGLTGEDCQNITGVSNNIPADEIVKLIFNFQSDCQKIGFLYTSSEANSVSTIASAMATYTNVAYTAGILVYCGADSMVADGRFGAAFPESAYEGYDILVEADGTNHFGQ